MKLSATMLAALLRAVSPFPSARGWRDEGEVHGTDRTLAALHRRGLVGRPDYTYGDRTRYATAQITTAGREAVARAEEE